MTASRGLIYGELWRWLTEHDILKDNIQGSITRSLRTIAKNLQFLAQFPDLGLFLNLKLGLPDLANKNTVCPVFYLTTHWLKERLSPQGEGLQHHECPWQWFLPSKWRCPEKGGYQNMLRPVGHRVPAYTRTPESMKHCRGITRVGACGGQVIDGKSHPYRQSVSPQFINPVTNTGEYLGCLHFS